MRTREQLILALKDRAADVLEQLGLPESEGLSLLDTQAADMLEANLRERKAALWDALMSCDASEYMREVNHLYWKLSSTEEWATKHRARLTEFAERIAKVPDNAQISRLPGESAGYQSEVSK